MLSVYIWFEILQRMESFWNFCHWRYYYCFSIMYLVSVQKNIVNGESWVKNQL